MKCQMSAEGVVQIIAESEVEAFALKMWDRSKVEVETKDHWALSIQASKDFLALVNERRDAYEAFLRKEFPQTQSGDSDA